MSGGRDLRWSIKRHSHIRLSDAEFDAALKLLRYQLVVRPRELLDLPEEFEQPRSVLGGRLSVRGGVTAWPAAGRNRRDRRVRSRTPPGRQARARSPTRL